MVRLPLEVIVGSNYVRYETLGGLIAQAYNDPNVQSDQLNIFIDLYSIIKPMFTSDRSIEYDMTSELELSADILNMCAHYRLFFDRLKVNTKIFLIFGLNRPENNAILSKGYNDKFYSSYIAKPKLRELVEKNMKSLELLCMSLPHIYYFNIGNMEVSSYIEYILQMHKLNDKSLNPTMENMVISKDVLPLQLVSSGCTVLRPKKSKGSDSSFIVSHINFWNSFMSEVRNVKVQDYYKIDPALFANILAMTRVPERCMNSIKSVPVVCNYILKAIEMGYITKNQDFDQATINKVLEILGVNTNYTTLEMRWKAISSKFMANYIIPNDPRISNPILIELNDPDSIREIVARYYEKSPIDLDRL